MQKAITPAEISNFVVPNYYLAFENKSQAGIFSKFINWCQQQEGHRILWLALTFLGLIGTAVPITILSIMFLTGNNFGLWIAVCALNVPVLAINLAAQPTKITIPALFLAWIADAAIILYCVVYFFMS